MTAAGSTERETQETNDSALEEELLVNKNTDGALEESDDWLDEGGEGDVGALS